MARPHHHVIDFHFPDERIGYYRREVMRIDVADDAEALAEAARLDGWKKSSFYQVRAIMTSTRSGDRVIFSTLAPDHGEVLIA